MENRVHSRSLAFAFGALLALTAAGADAAAPSATNGVAAAEWPTALAPAKRDFAAKCKAGTATRLDLIALKRFIAASAVDGAVKTNLTREVRQLYQRSKKRE